MDFIFTKSTKKGKEDYGSIHARIRTQQVNKKFSVGFLITEKEWETYRSNKYSDSIVMESLGIKFTLFANILEQIKQELEDATSFDNAADLIKSIKEALLKAYDPGKKRKIYQKVFYLSDYIAEIIERMENGTMRKSGRTEPLSKGTIDKYKNLLQRIRMYEETCEERLTLEDINMAFQQEFIHYCQDEGIYPNTIHGYLSMLQTIMKYAFQEKLTKLDGFRHSGFVTAQEEVDQVYLTTMQIQQMLDLDISSREKILGLIAKSDIVDEEKKEELCSYVTEAIAKRIEESRDVFIAGCLTGQRFSDYSRLCKEMITRVNGISFIRLTQVKTRKTVYIPIDIRVRTILKKYKGKMPRLDRGRMSFNVRILAELMGWTWKPDIDPSRMGKKIGTRFCDMISSHTARRSFATNAYQAGVPMESIMSITGHALEKNFRLYLRLDEKERGIMAARDFEGIMK